MGALLLAATQLCCPPAAPGGVSCIPVLCHGAGRWAVCPPVHPPTHPSIRRTGPCPRHPPSLASPHGSVKPPTALWGHTVPPFPCRDQKQQVSGRSCAGMCKARAAHLLLPGTDPQSREHARGAGSTRAKTQPCAEDPRVPGAPVGAGCPSRCRCRHRTRGCAGREHGSWRRAGGGAPTEPSPPDGEGH